MKARRFDFQPGDEILLDVSKLPGWEVLGTAVVMGPSVSDSGYGHDKFDPGPAWKVRFADYYDYGNDDNYHTVSEDAILGYVITEQDIEEAITSIVKGARDLP